MSAVHALRGVSLEVKRGERLALLGKSGSGKSTLLNLLAGLDMPTSGRILVDGEEITRMPRRFLCQYRLFTVGMIFQSYNLIASQTALQNVALPLMVAGMSPADRRVKAEAALRNVGLENRLFHRPAELSGGEQQRVAIARALINEPKILLADEPTGNLDSPTAAGIVDLLLSDAKTRGTTIVLITHDNDLADEFADRIIRMKDGSLLEE
ncbi:MAG: ABC transporter ATP-binding protein [Planctomycetaceae bacterium]